MKKATNGQTLCGALALALAALFTACQSTPTRTAAKMQRLQGTWEGVLVGQEKDGKITVTITGHSLHFYRDTNFWYETTFTLPPGTDPQQMRTTITGGKDSIGNMVPAIFKTGDGNLTLAVNQDNEHEPPKGFDDDTPGIIHYEFWRVQKKKVEVSTASATNQPPPTPAIAEAPDEGRKHPVEIAKVVSGPDGFRTPIAFQNNSAGVRKLYWLDTNGERQLYRELKLGENYELGTYLNHAWVVTDSDGNALGLYYPDGQKRTVTLE